ncbi:MAG: RfaE bifunctional protein, protein [uncultured bacterium]|uniref:RfaE bifunctional protein n=1 Tax=Berkelbacteria bacterium GW2011_GWA2_38_9 TaxID=1618334 RepID=A0A0G0NMB8_9BACT|nr:MAG: RfaE bifunctional protein, protein [uncultured bacterium]KKQ87064.1 MAG: RfaE bifunctional protein [Berkelbacteria bacterium GW2011_GWA2_38_9]
MSIKPENLNALVKKFSDQKVLECGDLMLDFTIEGKAVGLAPEAACVKILTRASQFKFTSGGAANCAKNFSSLGADTTAWGIVDFENHADSGQPLSFGHILIDTLNREKIKWIGEADPDRETTVKLRVQGANSHTAMQQIVRVDLEVYDPYPPKDKKKLTGNFTAYHAGDYNKGAVTPELIKILRSESKKKKVPLVVDPKMGEARDENYYHALYHDVTAITPNDLELKELTGENFEEDDERQIVKIAKDYAKQLNTDVVVTRGRFGAIVCPISGESTNIQTLPVENPSVSGVGDTFAATFTLALAAGGSLVEATHLAVIASYLTVKKEGTASKVSQAEVKAEIDRRVKGKLYPFE